MFLRISNPILSSSSYLTMCHIFECIFCDYQEMNLKTYDNPRYVWGSYTDYLYDHRHGKWATKIQKRWLIMGRTVADKPLGLVRRRTTQCGRTRWPPGFAPRSPGPEPSPTTVSPRWRMTPILIQFQPFCQCHTIPVALCALFKWQNSS